MSQCAVLAHEYYGHRPYRAQYLLEYEQLDLGNDELLLVLARREWADEFRASYMAAKYAPGLTQEDRYYLILDALERAREAFISIKYNDFIRRALHGTNQHKFIFVAVQSCGCAGYSPGNQNTLLACFTYWSNHPT